MKRVFGATVLMGLVAFSATSVAAMEPGGAGDESGQRIIVVNESVTPVRVYVEDSDGERYELGRLERGETQTFQAPSELASGEFRVNVDPGYYAQRLRDPVKVTTRVLHVGDDDTVVLWLERDLSRSTVEVWAG